MKAERRRHGRPGEEEGQAAATGPGDWSRRCSRPGRSGSDTPAQLGTNYDRIESGRDVLAHRDGPAVLGAGAAGVAHALLDAGAGQEQQAARAVPGLPGYS